MFSSSYYQKKKEKRFPGQGFSLIELLISSAITFFLLLGAGQLVLHSILFQHRSEKDLYVSELINRKMEIFKSYAYERLDSNGEEKSEVLQGEGIEEAYLLRWVCQEISPGLKKIVITCYPHSEPQSQTRSVLYLSQIMGF